MDRRFTILFLFVFSISGTFLLGGQIANADTLSLTSGNNATTTPNVATSITGFQIVGAAASTTPVKIHVTSGTVHVSTISGVTMSGNDTNTLNLSGTVANLNSALSTLTYTRASTGTDTLEVALVNSNQIYFPTNGHVYQYVSSSLTWNAAYTASHALTAYGATGYLVTITSSAENDFVKARLSGDAWIGASDAASEGVWKWVDGPENGTQFWQGAGGGSAYGGNYASWNGGEPNDSGANEDCAEEYVANGTWNDLPCSGSTISGYVAEFGSSTDVPNVVSKNVSIVTADVPSLVSIFPATGATNATTTVNLVLQFTKAVTKNSGNILIKKTSDDSTVESVDVSGAGVSGSGTTVIGINRSVALAEGIQYYIVVPGTAFKDGSNNFYDGISATSTWTFTTADLTAPSLSSVSASSTATTTGSIIWSTNEAASTKVVYSADNLFASTTSQTDTNPRVTSHTVTLTGLLACTLYNYKVVSGDAAGNYATSTSNNFITAGCAAGLTPSSATTTSILVSGVGSTAMTDSGRTLTVTTPANFTATSSSVIIQIKSLPSTSVLDSIGKPSVSLNSAAGIVFDVTALINNATVLDSFNSPISLSYVYTDADISGLNESSLVMYHYHNGTWLPLDNCSVDAANNTITCNASSFSTFAIFGTPVQATSSTYSNSSGTIQQRVAFLIEHGQLAEANALKAQWYWLFPEPVLATSVQTPVRAPLVATSTQTLTKTAPVATSTQTSAKASLTASTSTEVYSRDLFLGMMGDDVLSLQKKLNAAGFTIAKEGPGSSGNETTFFGLLTKAALIRYQKSNDISPAYGYFGPLTRVLMKN